jgi:hypothetical protein
MSVLVFLLLGTIIVGSGLLIDDRIVRRVAAREGRRYSWLWLLSSYWQWRMFEWRSYVEAREAGLLFPRLVVQGAMLIFIGAMWRYGVKVPGR